MMQETVVNTRDPLEELLVAAIQPEVTGSILDHVDAAEDSQFERLLKVSEAAELVGVHPKTLQAMARTGTVPCLRLGKYWLFRASSLDAWVRDRLESDHQSRRVELEDKP